MGQLTMGSAPFGLGEYFAGGALFGSLRSSNSLWQAGHLQAEQCFLEHIG